MFGILFLSGKDALICCSMRPRSDSRLPIARLGSVKGYFELSYMSSESRVIHTLKKRFTMKKGHQ